MLDPARYLVHCYVHCEIGNLSRCLVRIFQSIHQKLWDCRHMQFERVCAREIVIMSNNKAFVVGSVQLVNNKYISDHIHE